MKHLPRKMKVASGDIEIDMETYKLCLEAHHQLQNDVRYFKNGEQVVDNDTLGAAIKKRAIAIRIEEAI